MKKTLLITCALLSIGVLSAANAKLIYKVDSVEPEIGNIDPVVAVGGVQLREVADKKTAPAPEDPQAPDEIQD